MNRVALFLISGLALPVAQCLAQRAPGTAPFAITHVTVVDVSNGTLAPDHTVVIAGDRIRAVGSAASVIAPDDARVVDGTGKYLIPGLWDMHAHAFSPRLHSLAIPLLVANGVTGVRDLWGNVATARDIRREVASGQRLAPRSVVAGNLVDGPPGIWGDRSVVVDTPERGRAVVDSLARTGVAFIKVYSLLAPDTYAAIAEEAKRIGIPFAGHVPARVRAADASDRGQRSFEHLFGVPEGCSRDEQAAMEQDWLGFEAVTRGDTAQVRVTNHKYLELVVDGFDAARCDELLARLARNETWNVPTQTVAMRTLLPGRTNTRDPHLRYVSAGDRKAWSADTAGAKVDAVERPLLDRFWAVRERIIRRMFDLGVPLLAGSDHANPFVIAGFSLHEELGLLVQAGLTPLQALQTATLNPARFLGATDSLGTIAPGKLADLVLLDADPLRDITNTRKIRAVVLGGRYVDRPALDLLLREAARTASAK